MGIDEPSTSQKRNVPLTEDVKSSKPPGDISRSPGQNDSSPRSHPLSGVCCHNKPKGRNLIISLDGTSNKFGKMNTNVIELYSLLEKSDSQLTWYNSGIGTYARPSWRSFKYWKIVIDNKIDLAIAWPTINYALRKFEKTIMGAYQWLSDNYREGDRIFLFGFSRGAFQVRVLSAMIDKVGLIHKGNEMQIPFAYEVYADPSTDELESEDEDQEWDEDRDESSSKKLRYKKSTNNSSMRLKFMHKFLGRGKFRSDLCESISSDRITTAERFKRTFSHRDVKVHFIGVWDTVSSIGVLRGSKMLPRTVDGMNHACFFRQALALDERRVKFLPEYAYGGNGIPEEASSTKFPRIKEVWFAGTHSDIGGGNVENPKLNRTRPPLRWMVFEATALGLYATQFTRDLLNKELVNVKKSLTCWWWPFELLPFRRLTYSRRPDRDGNRATWRCHRGKPRKIQTGQKIHNSLLFSTMYTSKASIPPSLENKDFWTSLQDVAQGRKRSEESQFYDTWVELDLYDYISHALEQFMLHLSDRTTSTFLDNIRELTKRSEGKRTLLDILMNIIFDTQHDRGIKELIISNMLDILDPRLFTFTRRDFGELLDALMRSSRTYETRSSPRSGEAQIGPSTDEAQIGSSTDGAQIRPSTKQFLARFCKFNHNVISESTGHILGVLSVTFLPDGERLVSGSSDCTIRVWDARTGAQIGNPLTGHGDIVSSVSVSPDGKHIVSGSADETIRLWNMETQAQAGGPWTGHTDSVTCIAMSPNGKHVASGSNDKTIRLWDALTGESIGNPLNTHEGAVLSVAYSPNSLHVASGSLDATTRIWDEATQTQLGAPLGHEDSTFSVSFSPIGNKVVSGLRNNEIHLYDLETRHSISKPFWGHTDSVKSVGFSPDGKLLVSGSSDRTVRIWDAETGAQVGDQLVGHTDWVTSVAFSPDGNKVVSASLDKTIRVWDIGEYIKWLNL